MILVRYFVFVFFSILSFTTTNLSGQQVINDSLLKKMKFYSDSLRNSYNQQTRFSANDSFIELLKEFLSDDNSYNVEPDSINTVAFVRSPDNKFRFISWLLADNQGNYKSYGIIQHKDKKGEVYNTWLREKIISDIKELENTEYGVEEWPGPFPFEGDPDPDLINAGKQTITTVHGSSFFDSAMSFGMIRAGKVDLTVLGAMEVSDCGDIANWKIPGKMVKGMGGAMDLVASAKNIIVAMQHVNKAGESKLLKECTLPITGLKCVKKVVTELGVFNITSEGFELIEIAPDVSIEYIKQKTE